MMWGRCGSIPIACTSRKMGLIHGFTVSPVAKGRKEHEVRVRTPSRSAEVLLTGVGFGVFGRIANWPDKFFGEAIGETEARMDAMFRKMGASAQAG